MLIVADNLNILNQEIARALDEWNPEPIRRWARRCITGGCRAFDDYDECLPGKRYSGCKVL